MSTIKLFSDFGHAKRLVSQLNLYKLNGNTISETHHSSLRFIICWIMTPASIPVQKYS